MSETRKVSDQEILEWVERHDLRVSGATDARAAFEDARTLDVAPLAADRGEREGLTSETAKVLAMMERPLDELAMAVENITAHPEFYAKLGELAVVFEVRCGNSIVMWRRHDGQRLQNLRAALSRPATGMWSAEEVQGRARKYGIHRETLMRIEADIRQECAPRPATGEGTRGDVREALEAIEKAHAVVSKLCSGDARWVMSIPAQPCRRRLRGVPPPRPGCLRAGRPRGAGAGHRRGTRRDRRDAGRRAGVLPAWALARHRRPVGGP